MRFPFHATAVAPAQRQPRPPSVPEVPGASIAARYCEERTGGDFFDFAMTPSGRLLVLMTDIAGKRDQTFGIAAALQEQFHELAPKLFPNGDGNESLALSELALNLNRGVMRAANGVRCTAAFLACYDPRIGTTWYINAGHTPGLLVTAAGEATELAAGGIPFGLFSHTPHDAQLVVLQPAASLVLVSKGLAEVRGGSSEFGVAGVREAAAKSNRGSARDLCQAVLDASDSFIAAHPRRIPIGGQHRHPDRTALAVIRADRRRAAIGVK